MRWFLLIAVVLCSCASERRSPARPMPERVAGWMRAAPPKETAPLADAPRAWEAEYRGEPDVHVVLCEMPAQASAFEALRGPRYN